MFKVSHSTLIFLSGFIWLAIGCFLLPLGLNFVVAALLDENQAQPHPILNFLASYVGSIDSAALVWIVLALFIGFLKGRKVFAKGVKRSVGRILTLPSPISLSKIYPPSYYLLLGSMVVLGILMRYITEDLRGGIDIAVGFALINGAILFFREAWLVSRMTSSPSHPH